MLEQELGCSKVTFSESGWMANFHISGSMPRLGGTTVLSTTVHDQIAQKDSITPLFFFFDFADS